MGFLGTKLSIYGGFKGNETDLSNIEGIGEYPAKPLIMNGNGSSRIFSANFYPAKPGRKVIFFGLELINAKGKTPESGGGEIGGALEIWRSGLELIRTKWINNYSNGAGAIFANEAGDIRISKAARFENNVARLSGGAMTIIGKSLTFDGIVEFINNNAEVGNGGAFRAAGSTVEFNAPVIFKDNRAFIASAFWSDGLLKGSENITGAKKTSEDSWDQI